MKLLFHTPMKLLHIQNTDIYKSISTLPAK